MDMIYQVSDAFNKDKFNHNKKQKILNFRENKDTK